MTVAEFGSFAELVLTRSDERGDADAFVFLSEGARGAQAEHLPYAELDRAARDVASWLQERRLQGRQVLLLYPSGPEFVKAFIGCCTRVRSPSPRRSPPSRASTSGGSPESSGTPGSARC
ncbi:hypothetical protein [Streptomyces katsurahamanus]|uniref:hypothetical protein n=1 Tax=Streptomyces katsurahamanus TaxID=2577098 RepID=UPI001E426BFC|nr:hypothetical protein [Streptomyces katsurahamanus]